MGAPNPFDLPWLKRLMALEPALIRALVTSVVGLGALLGYNWAAGGDQAVLLYGAAILVLGAVQALWTRLVVTPTDKVAAVVRSDGQLEAGPAAPQDDGDLVIVSTPEPYDPSKVDNSEPVED